MLLLELIMAVKEVIDIEIEGVVGELLVCLDNAGHRVRHGLIVGLHLKQQQNQRAQRLHPALIGLTQGQHRIAHRIGVHQLTAVQHLFEFGRIIHQPGVF